MPNNGSVSPQPSTFIDLLEWRKNRSSRRPPSVTSETLETTESPPAIIEPQRTAEPVPSTQYPETPFGTRPTYQGVVIFHSNPENHCGTTAFLSGVFCAFLAGVYCAYTKKHDHRNHHRQLKSSRCHQTLLKSVIK